MAVREEQNRIFKNSIDTLQIQLNNTGIQSIESNSLIKNGSFKAESKIAIDIMQTQQSLLLRKKAQLIQEELKDDDHPLKVLINKFKESVVLLDPEYMTMPNLCKSINEFVDFLFSSMLKFFKFRRIQDHQCDESYEPLLRS